MFFSSLKLSRDRPLGRPYPRDHTGTLNPFCIPFVKKTVASCLSCETLADTGEHDKHGEETPYKAEFLIKVEICARGAFTTLLSVEPITSACLDPSRHVLQYFP